MVKYDKLRDLVNDKLSKIASKDIIKDTEEYMALFRPSVPESKKIISALVKALKSEGLKAEDEEAAEEKVADVAEVEGAGESEEVAQVEGAGESKGSKEELKKEE